MASANRLEGQLVKVKQAAEDVRIELGGESQISKALKEEKIGMCQTATPPPQRELDLTPGKETQLSQLRKGRSCWREINLKELLKNTILVTHAGHCAAGSGAGEPERSDGEARERAGRVTKYRPSPKPTQRPIGSKGYRGYLRTQWSSNRRSSSVRDRRAAAERESGGEKRWSGRQDLKPQERGHHECTSCCTINCPAPRSILSAAYDPGDPLSLKVLDIDIDLRLTTSLHITLDGTEIVTKNPTGAGAVHYATMTQISFFTRTSTIQPF
ncbi:MAG: hypothetical protein MMC33_008742 [Icmadophila ericetorum]|nr:hypothetical protein [Icmadophila ericetorum]